MRWVLRHACGLAALWAGLMTTGSADASVTPVRILVAVGSNYGLAQEAPLRWADHDATSVRDVMSSLGGVSADRTILRTQARVGEVRAALTRARRIAASYPPDSVTLIFYYSGHGSKEALHLGGERLPLSEVRSAIEAVPARMRLVIVDACREGPGRGKGLVTDAAPFEIALAAPAGPEGLIQLHATSAGEAAQESDDLGGAVFTSYLVSGLRGAADADEDRQVTFDEVYRYAYRQTHRRSAATASNVQRPELEMDITGAGLVTLTRLDVASASLILPPGDDARYVVYAMPSGAVMGEIWGRKSTRARLALPAGRFEVQRHGDDSHAVALAHLPYGGSQSLEAADFEPVDLQTLRAKGGTILTQRHAVGVGYGAMLHGDAGAFGHRVRVRYQHRVAPHVSVSFGVEGGLSDYDTAAHLVQEWWLGGDVRLSIPIALGPIELSPSLAGLLVWLDRTTTRRDDVGIAGFERRTEGGGLALGPELSLGFSAPMTANLWLTGSIGGAVLVYEEASDVTTRWQGNVDLGIDWRF